MVKQGEIIKVNLNPKQGHEQQGYRLFICLSHELVNTTSNIGVFAPISNTAREYPFYVELEETETTGKVLLDQVMAIDYNARSYTHVESVSDDFLIELLDKVKLVFEKN
ncbi:type II toxin-antitoxin system PemK/MazF family toxin [Fundicoccus sp. Sow4_D5]|uniref:type II toxin-antitoxin system PemK/MazF family toxin n=1 Tax=Fundicoccus sp. Sow4_D5 TaxID=3438782 RepID=UPI003F8E8F33